MAIKVMLFGQLAELAGMSNVVIEDAVDTQTLQHKIHILLPAIDGTTYRIAVDKKMVTENTPLTNKTIVALLPPFSGG